MHTQTKEPKQTTKHWPTPQDFNEAIQTLGWSLSDPELQQGRCEINALGLPKVTSGAFASVYRINCGSKSYAVRCFLRNAADQATRYEMISRYVMQDLLPYTVPFEYQPQGICVAESRFPILKMEWVEGVTLDRYIEQHKRK